MLHSPHHKLTTSMMHAGSGELEYPGKLQRLLLTPEQELLLWTVLQ